VKGILFLLFISTFVQARCFVQVFLGAADEPRHFHRGRWVTAKAEEMGCLVFKTFNEDVNSTGQKLKTFFEKNNFDPNKDRLHISYVDHGSSSSLPHGGSWADYDETLEVLDNSVPQGTDITFSSHICWPGFHEELASSKFNNIKSMCGGSSVDNDNLSNAYSGTADSSRMKEYLPAGWDYWADEYDTHEGNDFLQAIGIDDHDHEAGHKNTNMFNFHYQSIGNDMDNLIRGSALTSLTFARRKLDQIGASTYKNPLEYLFGNSNLGEITLYDKKKNAVGETNQDDVCVSCSIKVLATGFEDIIQLSSFANGLETAAIQSQIDKLSSKNSQYQAFSSMYKNAKDFIAEKGTHYQNRASNYAVRLAVIQKKINQAEDNSNYDKSAELYEEYKDLEDEMLNEFKPLLVKLRQVNDVEMIVKLNEESPESMKKFESFMACERRNALDKI
jgi:hypothetical protein